MGVVGRRVKAGVAVVLLGSRGAARTRVPLIWMEPEKAVSMGRVRVVLGSMMTRPAPVREGPAGEEKS
jgi:hypothetical protein